MSKYGFQLFARPVTHEWMPIERYENIHAYEIYMPAIEPDVTYYTSY